MWIGWSSLLYFLLVCVAVRSQQQRKLEQDVDVALETGAKEVFEMNNLQFSVAHKLPGLGFQHRTKVQLIRKSDGKQSLIFPEVNAIQGEAAKGSFRQLLQDSELYTLRLHMTSEDGTESTVVTSIPACELQKSGFKEDILVYLDAASRRLIGVAYSSPVIGLSRECDPTKLPDSIVLQTRLKIADIVQAQTVPLQAVGPRPAYLQEVKVGTDDDKQQAPQQQSFLRRYWYIVVIMIIYVLLGSGGEPPKEGTGSAAAGSGASAAAGSQGAASAPR